MPVTPLSISLPVSSRVRPKNPSRTSALYCPRPGAALRIRPGVRESLQGIPAIGYVPT